MFANGRIRLWYFDKEGNSFGILVTWSHRAGGRYRRVNSIYDNNESSSVFAQMSTENLKVSIKKLFLLNLNGGARVGQWWEHKIPASAPCMGWVCFWFSPILLRKLFPRVLQFLLFLKTNTSKFQFDLERTDTSPQENLSIFQFTRDIHTLTDHRQMQSGRDCVPCCLATEFCMKQHSLWQLGRPVITQREAFRPGCLSVTFYKQRHYSF